MKFVITTHVPCTAEEYIVLKDCPEYKTFQVRPPHANEPPVLWAPIPMPQFLPRRPSRQCIKPPSLDLNQNNPKTASLYIKARSPRTLNPKP
jgi:hypothetical protein